MSRGMTVYQIEVVPDRFMNEENADHIYLSGIR
jgi:hypothetical protein